MRTLYYGDPEIPGIVWVIIIALAILQIVMIVKFFEIAANLNKIRKAKGEGAFAHIQEAKNWLITTHTDNWGVTHSPNHDKAINSYKKALICVDMGQYGEIPDEYLLNYSPSEDFAVYMKMVLMAEIKQVEEYKLNNNNDDENGAEL